MLESGKPTGPMTTLPLDTSFLDYPKCMAAGPIPSFLYLAAYLWITRRGTDSIPSGALGSLMDWSQVGMPWMEAAEACLRVGLFERVQGSWRLLSYKDAVH